MDQRIDHFIVLYAPHPGPNTQLVYQFPSAVLSSLLVETANSRRPDLLKDGSGSGSMCRITAVWYSVHGSGK